MKKIIYSLLLWFVPICIFAYEKTVVFNFTNPSLISPYYPNGTSLYSQTTWYSQGEDKCYIKTTPVGSNNSYSNIAFSGGTKRVLSLGTGSVIRVGVPNPDHIKSIEITCHNTAAKLTTSLGIVSDGFSSDYSEKHFYWSSENYINYYEVIFQVSSFLATIGQVKVTYITDDAPSSIEDQSTISDFDIKNNTIYSISGNRTGKLNKGFNIVKMPNGNTRKIFIK